MIEQFVAPAHGVLPVSHLDIPVITYATTGQLSQFSKAPLATPNMIATGGGGGGGGGGYGDFGDFGIYADLGGDGGDGGWYGDGGGESGGYDSGGDSNAVAIAAGISVKSTADISNLNSSISANLSNIASAFIDGGAPSPVITSGNDSIHKSNSLHYSDNAIDVRANNITPFQANTIVSMSFPTNFGYFQKPL